MTWLFLFLTATFGIETPEELKDSPFCQRFEERTEGQYTCDDILALFGDRSAQREGTTLGISNGF